MPSDAPPSPDRTYVRLLSLGLFCLGLPLSFLGFVLPIFGKALGSSTLQIGLLYTGFSATTLIVRPVIGQLTDRLGRRPFILLGLLGYAAALACLALAQGFNLLFAGRALQGMASSFLWIVSDASVADVSAPEARTRNFGAVTSAFSRGQLVGACLGFTMLFTFLGFHGGQGETQGMQLAFAVFSGLILLVTLFLTLKLPETRRRDPVSELPPPTFRLDRTWRVLLTASFSSAAAMMMISPLVMLLFQDRFHAPIHLIAMAYIPMGLVWGFAPGPLARIIDRFGKQKMMAASLLSGAGAALLVPLVPALWIMAVVWAITALLDVGGNMAEQSLIADLTHHHHFGKGYSLYVFVSDLGAALGPLIGTWLYTRSPFLPFLTASMIYLVTGLLVATGKQRR